MLPQNVVHCEDREVAQSEKVQAAPAETESLPLEKR